MPYAHGFPSVVPVGGVHALELYVTPIATVARLLTDGTPNKGYPTRLVDPRAEIKRLQDALRGGPAAFKMSLRSDSA